MDMDDDLKMDAYRCLDHRWYRFDVDSLLSNLEHLSRCEEDGRGFVALYENIKASRESYKCSKCGQSQQVGIGLIKGVEGDDLGLGLFCILCSEIKISEMEVEERMASDNE